MVEPDRHRREGIAIVPILQVKHDSNAVLAAFDSHLAVVVALVHRSHDSAQLGGVDAEVCGLSVVRDQTNFWLTGLDAYVGSDDASDFARRKAVADVGGSLGQERSII